MIISIISKGPISVVYVEALESALFLLRLGVSVLYEEHGYKGKCYENCSEREEHGSHAERVVKEAREDGSNYLCRHGSGVIVARVFSDLAALCQLNDHGEGVYVYGSPTDTRKNEYGIHKYLGGVEVDKVSNKECRGEKDYSREDGLFSSDL